MEEKIFTKSQKLTFGIIAIIIIFFVLVIGTLYSKNMILEKQNAIYNATEEQNNTNEKESTQYTQDSEGNFIPLP